MNGVRPIASAAEAPSELMSRVFGYWSAKCAARGNFAPARGDIVPQELRGDLASIWLVDYDAAARSFGFRLAGQELVRFLGPNAGAPSLDAVPRIPFFERVRAVFTACVEKKLPLLVGPAPTSYALRNFQTITVLVTPLSENGRDVSMLFGAFEAA